MRGFNSPSSLAATVLMVVSAATMLPASAAAEILIQVDKSTQRMSVSVDGQHRYTWAVSTGVGGTPSGNYRPQSLDRNHRSNLYGGAPMPYSIFYSGNFAIHGTTFVGRLGTRASHGCIRLHPSNAATLFAMVQNQMGSTRIQIR
jgi:lipoprotein-anchoring transpeptidase ErfK/SrfK